MKSRGDSKVGQTELLGRGCREMDNGREGRTEERLKSMYMSKVGGLVRITRKELNGTRRNNVELTQGG